jgi:hypothetical protein
VAGRIRSIEKIHLIGTRARDFLACRIVAEPTTLLRAPINARENCKMYAGQKLSYGGNVKYFY